MGGLSMGKLYMVDTRTGEQTLISSAGELVVEQTELIAEAQNYVIGCDFAATASFTATIDRRAMLSIFYGHKITNNWLKRHGGVMSRKINRRYRK